MSKKYNLVGVDGNAFSIMGYVSAAMRACGKSKTERNAYMADAMGGDYTNVLIQSQRIINELNDTKLKLVPKD